MLRTHTRTCTEYHDLQWMMRACKHMNQPLFRVSMPRQALSRATDPNHHVPTGYRRRWDGSNAPQIAGRVLIHLAAGIRQPASCWSILGTLQATSPDALWHSRGWRGACWSHAIRKEVCAAPQHGCLPRHGTPCDYAAIRWTSSALSLRIMDVFASWWPWQLNIDGFLLLGNYPVHHTLGPAPQLATAAMSPCWEHLTRHPSHRLSSRLPQTMLLSACCVAYSLMASFGFVGAS